MSWKSYGLQISFYPFHWRFGAFDNYFAHDVWLGPFVFTVLTGV